MIVHGQRVLSASRPVDGMRRSLPLADCADCPSRRRSTGGCHSEKNRTISGSDFINHRAPSRTRPSFLQLQRSSRSSPPRRHLEQPAGALSPRATLCVCPRSAALAATQGPGAWTWAGARRRRSRRPNARRRHPASPEQPPRSVATATARLPAAAVMMIQQ